MLGVSLYFASNLQKGSEMNDWDFSEAYELRGSRAELAVSVAIAGLCAAGAACFFGTVWLVTSSPALSGWLLAGGIGCLGLVSVLEWASEQ